MTGTTKSAPGAERRIFQAGAALLAIGTAITAIAWGAHPAVSFFLGGALAALNLAWLRAGISRLVFSDSRSSQKRVLAGYLARLLLIPLALYAILRLLFLSLPAAAAGFATFYGGVLVEGVLEAFRIRSR